jgi:uncharacterized membrane protein
MAGGCRVERAFALAQARDRVMMRYMTVGLSVLAGVALFEVALIPAVAIGGAAILAPTYLRRRRVEPIADGVARPPVELPASVPQGQKIQSRLPTLQRLAVGSALAKTITFRIVVTTIDFTSNYVVIGSLATAAGLSTLALALGPVFYFAHETAWNYFATSGTDVALPRGFVISRRLAKTITFRVIATAADFTTLYLGTGDLATAAILTAFGFVVGPFVYLGHEMAWDYFTAPRQRRVEPQRTTNLAPVIGPSLVAA